MRREGSPVFSPFLASPWMARGGAEIIKHAGYRQDASISFYAARAWRYLRYPLANVRHIFRCNVLHMGACPGVSSPGVAPPPLFFHHL